MICERCGQSAATVHMKQIVNGESHEARLCVECATAQASESGSPWSGPSFHQLLGGLLGTEGAWSSVSRSGSLRCPNCGLRFADFRRLGHFGCSQCYETFAEPLETVLRRMQGSTTHKGKIPANAAGDLKVRRERERLELQLKELIQQEEYEQAAVVRDKLRALERRTADGRSGRRG